MNSRIPKPQYAWYAIAMGQRWTTQKNLPRYRSWKKVGFILIFLHVVWFPVTWAEEEPTPEFLIRQVINTYRSLETYRVTGHTDREITDFNYGGKVFRTTLRFSILLKKPNGYRITWEQDHPDVKKMAWQEAVWNTGTQAYIYNKTANGYMKIPSDLVNLQSPVEVSMGKTSIIPELFFASFPEKDLQISRLKNLAVKGREKIEGEQCYVLEGRNRHMVGTYWISVADFHVRQFTFLVNNPNGEEMDFEATEEGAKELARSKGLEPTRERIEKFTLLLKGIKKTRKTQRTQVISTDHFSDISFPTVSGKDLQFAIPEGIPLKEDLYELSQTSIDTLKRFLDAKE